MFRFTVLLSFALCTLSLLGCEKRIEQTKQVAKELPSATKLTKDHVQGLMDKRLEQVNQVVADPTSPTTPSDKPDPTKQWVGPKPWAPSTNPEPKKPIKVNTP